MSAPTTKAEGIRAAELTRRRFATSTGAAAALAFSGQLVGLGEANASPAVALKSDPFQLGVASGDPLPDSVVLWTRLATDPLAAFSGMRQTTYTVKWEVASDPAFGRVVARGKAKAAPQWNHAVHVDVRGLRSSADYWYRFRVGGYISPVGHTRTAPAVNAANHSFSLAMASCQAIWEGWYTAYADMVTRDFDAVLFLGDYIYEFGIDRGVRPESGQEQHTRQTSTLDEYRNRYSQYKMDPDLQEAHAAFPWIVTFDDHEVVNNWAGANGAAPNGEFLVRRANGFRAYWENMPLRFGQRPVGPDLKLYRRLRFGKLAELSVLDTRSYRSKQANGDGTKPPTPESKDPSRTITGAAQEAWLLDGLGASTARWNLLGQQTAMTRLDLVRGDGVAYAMDAWDGYEASRNRVLQGIVDRDVDNVVSLGGDYHRSIASNLTLDFDDPAATPVATEFIGTSITSGLDGEEIDATSATMIAENPAVKFVNFKRGYNAVTLTKTECTVEHRGVDRVTVPDGTVSTRKTLTVQSGVPGIQGA